MRPHHRLHDIHACCTPPTPNCPLPPGALARSRRTKTRRDPQTTTHTPQSQRQTTWQGLTPGCARGRRASARPAPARLALGGAAARAARTCTADACTLRCERSRFVEVRGSVPPEVVVIVRIEQSITLNACSEAGQQREGRAYRGAPRRLSTTSIAMASARSGSSVRSSSSSSAYLV